LGTQKINKSVGGKKMAKKKYYYRKKGRKKIRCKMPKRR